MSDSNPKARADSRSLNQIKAEHAAANAVAPEGSKLSARSHAAQHGQVPNTAFKAEVPWAGGLLGDEAQTTATVYHNKDGSEKIRIDAATDNSIIRNGYRDEAIVVVNIDKTGHAQIDPKQTVSTNNDGGKGSGYALDKANGVANKVVTSVNSAKGAPPMKASFKGYQP